MKHTFLLEVGLEDMPANVIVQAENQLVEKTKAFLQEAKLTFGNVQGFSTPRRFAVLVEDLAERQPDENLTVRGPAQRIAQDEEGNWTKAAIGFSKGQGGSVEDLVIKEDKGEPYVYIEKHIPGLDTKELLKGLNEVVKKIDFPKNMKWGTTNYHYIRPIHWLVALLDEEVIPFEVFDVQTSNHTKGHRFIGESITLQHPSEYEEKLNAQHVIVNRSKRKALIIEQLEKLCEEKNWVVPTSYSDLLEEVTDLVEYPTVFYGEFNKDYLEVPEVVLETSMIDHQRYFPVRENSEDKPLLPFFIAVRNGDAKHLDNVARGNEKVLSARLADSKFFYIEDQKLEIADFVDKLKRVDYHEKLGTIYEKQTRAKQMVEVFAKYYPLSDEEKTQLERMTDIYKFDLVTQIVDEFPTLQGEIGAIYARERDEQEEVALAIRDQYLPKSVTGPLPETTLGKYLALIDKLDTLIQFFTIGLIPTGSNDPYALRRQAIGAVRIMNDLQVDEIELNDFISDLIQASKLPENRQLDLAENQVALVDFIINRLEQMMQTEYDIAHDIRQAAIESTHQNLSWMLEVALVLEKEKESEGFKSVVESITRVTNMTKNIKEVEKIDEDLLETDSEKSLVSAISTLQKEYESTTDAKERYDALQKISSYITEFFEHNMIMVEDEKIKNNRLTILKNIAVITKQFADFSQLVL